MGIRLLGTLALANASIDGIKLTEISGLAWDEDEQVLYALSDHGHLLHLHPKFRDGILVDAELLRAFKLRDKAGRPLRGMRADSEGLAIIKGHNGKLGDAELIVSFERHPRVLRFRPDGTFLRQEPLNPLLRNIRRYAGKNDALEAVAVHPKWGILTGPEKPLRGIRSGLISLYPQKGRPWQYESYDAENSALVDMVTLPDASLLTLERAYVSLLHPIVITLRRVWLADRPGSNPPPKVEDVAIFNSDKGWFIDNFEGLAHHRGQRFFMVSDDNDRFIQRTLLLYFELKDH
jgi:hypothetical protein